jgi:selenocysteine lyase/cysteine desulfurase
MPLNDAILEPLERASAIGAALNRPEMRALGVELVVTVDPLLGRDFALGTGGSIALSPIVTTDEAACAVALRHAAEQALLSRMEGIAPALATLVAARVAGLYLHSLPADEVARCSEIFSAELMALYDRATETDPLIPAEPFMILAAPTDHLLISDGDLRLKLDPATGQNQYGCSPRPCPDLIQMATTTATSLSERAFGTAERLRQNLLSAALQGRLDQAYRATLDDIRQAIGRAVSAGPDAEIVLTPSGTDTEFYAVEIALAGTKGRLTNLIVAPEETGSGIIHAAIGRHFNGMTALGEPVNAGGPIDGCHANRVTIASMPYRTSDGAALPAADIDQAVERAVEQAIARGERVLLHLIDVSKTGLILPSVACVERLKARFPVEIDVVVDACQMRLSKASYAAYLQRGYMLMITGSKFFGGPPFAGALVVPGELAARAASAGSLPCGYQAYSSRDLWPAPWANLCQDLPVRCNPGLALRWTAALAEIAAFEAVPDETKQTRLAEFADAVAARLSAHPVCLPLASPAIVRGAASWDRLCTIFPFMLRGPDGDPLSLARAKQVHKLLNADLSECLPATVTARERAVAARRCQIGQAVKVATRNGEAIGALRIAAGSIVADDTMPLAAWIADLDLILDKIALIVAHLDEFDPADGPLAAQPTPALV